MKKIIGVAAITSGAVAMIFAIQTKDLDFLTRASISFSCGVAIATGVIPFLPERSND